ncbi:MAG: thiaminase II [Synergistaceae bacterium]|jgi:thiaminase/transcriptional activator TenA|nr:thiaminase II [Synergistaceae bacterium]
MSFSRSLRERSSRGWEECYLHPFVQELGAGALDRETFKFYLTQDYIYLIEYAKVFAFGVIKSTSERMMSNFTAAQHAILCGEMELHRNYMRNFGAEPGEACQTKQSLLGKAYTSNMMSVASTGGPAEIIAVILPCAWSYYDYAVRLRSQFASGLEDNFYRSWVEGYSSDEYLESFEWMFSDLDSLCQNRTPGEQDALWEIFQTSIEFEYLFWDMAYKRQISHSN